MDVFQVEAPPPVAGVIVASTLFPLLAAVTVVLRFCTRHWYRIPVKADDWLMLAGMVFTIGACACGVLAVGGGADLPLSVDQMVASAKASLARQLLYILAEPCIKCSIILFYLRLFPSRNFRIVSYAVAAFTICWAFAFVVASFVQCAPTARMWDKTLPGSCFNIVGFYSSKSVTNLVTDLIILVMPCPMVWQLKLPTRKKIQLLGVFTLGGFACLVAIIQLEFIVKARGGILTDPYYSRYIVTWSSLELSSGIACACLVTLGPMFRSSLPPNHSLNKIKKFSRHVMSCGKASDASWEDSTMIDQDEKSTGTDPSYYSSKTLVKHQVRSVPKGISDNSVSWLEKAIDVEDQEECDTEIGRPVTNQVQQSSNNQIGNVAAMSRVLSELE